MKEKFKKFLTGIYQNISTAVQSIEDISPCVENLDLKEELSKESSDYLVLQEECESIAKAEKINLKDNDWFEKVKLYTGIKLSTAFNKSPRNIAEKMLLGTVMGIITCIKDQCDYEGVSDELMELSKKLYSLQEENYKKLKPFLCVKD